MKKLVNLDIGAYNELWKLIEEGGDMVTNKTLLTALTLRLKRCYPTSIDHTPEGRPTLLVRAAECKREVVLHVLLEAGADPTKRMAGTGVNVLHRIMERCGDLNSERVFDCGFWLRDTMLCLQAIENKSRILPFFERRAFIEICKRDFVNAKNAEGFTPMMNIIRHRLSCEAVVLLKKNGAMRMTDDELQLVQSKRILP